MPETDDWLLNAARRGDESSFLTLYRRHRTSLFRFAWRLTGSVAAAEDIIQECFLALLKGARYDAAHCSLRPYLFGITRHLALKQLRIDEREANTREPWELANTDAALDPLSDLLSAERAEGVARAVAALPPLQREALILFEYEELSLDEIAEITGVETGAVKARLYRARETLPERTISALSLGLGGSRRPAVFRGQRSS
jgi:RNA polymerase sigma-70 factor (ECF subfamily)